MSKISLTDNKWLRGVAYVVLGILALWLLLWLLVPPVLKSQGQKIASEQLGRAVTIGSVDFKPWSLELTVGDITVAGPAGSTLPTLHIDKVYANAAAQSVVRLAPVLDAVSVDGVQTNVTYLGDGKYDFDDILAKLAANKKPDDPSKGPARFALYNLVLTNSSANYRDVPLKRTHELRDLNLTVPFLSSFDGQRDVNVEPRLAFVLNGSRFDSAATSIPFAQTRKTDATITLSGLDLEPYLGYIPASVPFKVQGAVIDAQIRLGFEQTPQTSVKLSGEVKVGKLKIADASSRDLLRLDELKVALVDVRPLEHIAKIGAIEISAPSLSARRAADGTINLALGGTGAAPAKSELPSETSTAESAASSASASVASLPASSASAASGTAAGSSSSAWKIEVAGVALRNGKVSWADEATGAGTASLELAGLTVDAKDIEIPFRKPLTFKVGGALRGEGSAVAVQATSAASAATGTGPAAAATTGSGRFSAEGTATDKVAHAQVDIGDLPLSVAAPYLAAYLEPELGGRLNADIAVDWAAAGALKVSARTLTLDELALVSSLADDQRTSRRSTRATVDARGRSAGPAPGSVSVPSSSSRRNAASASAKSRASASALADSGASATASAATNSGASAMTSPAGAVARATAEASPAQSSDAPGKTTVVRIRQIRLVDADIDLAGSKATIGALTISEPRMGLSRGADKHWMYERWLKTGAAPSPTPVRPKAAWTATLGEFALDGGAITFVDNGVPQPVSFLTNDLKVRMSRLAMGAAPPSPLEVSARVGSGRTEFGTLDFKGTVGLEPLAAQGEIEVVRFPVHALQPYFGDVLNVELARADTSFKGNLRFAEASAGATARLTGDATVDNFRVNTLPGTVADSSAGSASAPTSGSAGDEAAPAAARQSGSVASTLSRQTAPDEGEELLSWKSLGLRGVAVSLAPATTTTVDVKETTITDMYARLILNENARLNLQDVLKSSDKPTQGSASSASQAASSAPRGSAKAVSATGSPAANSAGNSAAASNGTRAASAAGSSGPSASSSVPVVRFGPLSLVNAKVLFSDHFVKPNYSASLTELTGTLSAFSSVPAAGGGVPLLADLELRGRAENTASLEITGKLNPLAKPLALDIAAKVRDLELPPLTPYSVKYSGYGIQRGKMSVDVHYTVQPDGRLTAQNKLTLNQLSFGDKVAGSTASLPVKLAVALLADRNGVIDIDIPLSGSLNDPQFSLGAIIGKAVVNLLVKAITSPFSLLANAFGGSGGSDQLSAVEFKPGSVLLADDAKADLDKVAKALVDRPALKMTVVGTSSIDAERESYRRERLNQLLQAEKRKAAGSGQIAATAAAVAASSPGSSVALAAPVPITPQEYPALIKAVYAAADIAKPRNMIGMARDIEPAQMEALLLDNISVNDESIRELAVERGVAVRDYLASRQVPLERLFLGAPKAAQGIPAPTAVSSEAAVPAGASRPTGSASAPPGTSTSTLTSGLTGPVAAAVAAAASAPAANKAWTPSAELTLSPR